MNALLPFLCREFPEEFEPLINLALDLRLSWNRNDHKIWEALDPEAWKETHNPWWVLQNISQDRIEHLSKYKALANVIKEASEIWQSYINTPGWFRQNYPSGALGTVAYFSMEFGLNEGLPIYAGGLGMLAGDYLKSASDLDIPVTGIGMLYQEGYFRQMLDASGYQIASFPHNDPTTLPLKPAIDKEGGWLTIALNLPGRTLRLRVWQAQVGRIPLYLLDSNVQTNSPFDRSIISRLYDAQPEIRLMQEMVLGIAGWRVLKALDIPVEICHINEGHAAFVVLERALDYMQSNGISFPVALTATRAANVFTTHTPVAAGFDTYPSHMVTRYLEDYIYKAGLTQEEFLSLGRWNPQDDAELFNMAVLATRGSLEINGVSKLHENVSRSIFQSLYPGWPQQEVPVKYITNGVHIPTWCCKPSDDILTDLSRDYWLDIGDQLSGVINSIADEQIWAIRQQNKEHLIRFVHHTLEQHFKQFTLEPIAGKKPLESLKPDVLTIGFARRFTSYKRPNMLLHDKGRLERILNNADRPVQLIAAGKAHPRDEEGIRMIQQFVEFAHVRPYVVFLPDYDITLAQQLVQGVDVWINTPRRPWEACGTSGMKVLINGGLNLSELDGWWVEGYSPETGWHIGDGHEHTEDNWDATEAAQLYDILEKSVIPEYYDRDSKGLPRAWISRIRNSMSRLAPRFSSNRMLRDYVRKIYIPATLRLLERTADRNRLAIELNEWNEMLDRHWQEIHTGNIALREDHKYWHCAIEIFTGNIPVDYLKVELFADPARGHGQLKHELVLHGRIDGKEPCYLYRGMLAATRPINHLSLRIIPFHPSAIIPLEDNHIFWKYPLEA